MLYLGSVCSVSSGEKTQTAEDSEAWGVSMSKDGGVLPAEESIKIYYDSLSTSQKRTLRWCSVVGIASERCSFNRYPYIINAVVQNILIVLLSVM